MKKQHLSLLPYLFLAILIGLSGFMYVRNKDLKEQVTQLEAAQMADKSEFNTDSEELSQIDAMILDGDNYSGALMAYQEKYQEHLEDEESDLELRIALTQKMLDLKRISNRAKEKDSLQFQLDSLLNIHQSAPKEVRQYDSLGFALEKAKVRIARMQKQLKRKSAGQYLTFTNSKGTQMHYVGEVKDGKANGYGVAILSTGSRYVGEWKDNKRHGEGSFYWIDGQHYSGAYVNDKRYGQGSYFWPNGEKFVGLWKDDERVGEGAFYGKKGDVVASGVWDHDELVITNKP